MATTKVRSVVVAIPIDKRMYVLAIMYHALFVSDTTDTNDTSDTNDTKSED